MKIKLEDLAKELDISVAAVSMAINNKRGVSDETRKKVLDLALNKGYKFKPQVALKTQDKEEKKYIKLLRLKKHGLVASDTVFFATVIEGIEEECKKNGYELLVSYYSINDLDKAKIEDEYKSNVQGIIALATELDMNDMAVFCDLTQPFVILDSYFVNEEWDTVLMNNDSAAYQAVKHFVECGHKMIGYLKSSAAIYNFDKRFKGYIDALEKFDLPYESRYTIELEPTLVGAGRDMESIINNGVLELPTAFLADNDIIAVGAMGAMQSKNIRIPEDISIIGIDDMPFCQMVQPKLTTVKIFKKEIGRETVKTLLRGINKESEFTQKREINTKLIVRDSVRKQGDGSFVRI